MGALKLKPSSGLVFKGHHKMWDARRRGFLVIRPQDKPPTNRSYMVIDNRGNVVKAVRV